MVFLLVHGAHHVVWCWELLAPELEARGNAVGAAGGRLVSPAPAGGGAGPAPRRP